MIVKNNRRSKVKKVLFMLLGWPSYLRRVQWWTLEPMYLEKNIVVLDFGCGSGEDASQITKVNPTAHVVATDLDISNLHIKSDRITTLDVAAFWTTDTKFDRILLSSVLQMVDSPEAVLKNLEKFLNPKGEIHLTIPNKYFFFNNENYKEKYCEVFQVKGRGYIDECQLQQLLSNTNLEIVICEPIFDIATSFIWEAYLKFFLFFDYKILICFLPISKLVWSACGKSKKSSEFLYILRKK